MDNKLQENAKKHKLISDLYDACINDHIEIYENSEKVQEARKELDDKESRDLSGIGIEEEKARKALFEEASNFENKQ
jgi:uncharacterized UBP type Zn finger protein